MKGLEHPTVSGFSIECVPHMTRLSRGQRGQSGGLEEDHICPLQDTFKQQQRITERSFKYVLFFVKSAAKWSN